MLYLDASGPLPMPRDSLGEHVREAWVRWAMTQPDPKASWLVPYAELKECDKEADRQIGEHVCRLTMLAIASTNGSPANDKKISDAIIAAASELIESGYCTTSGLITRDALRYRLVGIIGKHLGKAIPGVVS